MSDIFMVIVYWLLTIFWIVVVSISVAYLVWRPMFNNIRSVRRIMQSFIALSIFFLIDSLYWSLANTSRIGFISKEVAHLMYNSWAIAVVKTVFFIAAAVFLATVKKTYQNIEHQTEALHFSRFADQSIDAIGVLGPQGKVVFWNRGAEHLYGHRHMEVIGRHIKEFLVPVDQHSQIDDVLEIIRSEKKAVRFTAERLKNDGTNVHVDITISPFFEGTKFGGYFGIMRPVEINKEFSLQSLIKKHAPAPSATPEESAMTKKNRILKEIAEAQTEENRDADRRHRLASCIAVCLLITTGILLVLLMVSHEGEKLFFGSGSILTTLGEIWPLRILLQPQNRLWEKTKQRILTIDGITEQDIKETLALLDSLESRGKEVLTKLPDNVPLREPVPTSPTAS